MSFWSENPDEMEMHIMDAMIDEGLATEDEASLDVYERWSNIENVDLYLKISDIAQDKFMAPRIMAAEVRTE